MLWSLVQQGLSLQLQALSHHISACCLSVQLPHTVAVSAPGALPGASLNTLMSAVKQLSVVEPPVLHQIASAHQASCCTAAAPDV